MNLTIALIGGVQWLMIPALIILCQNLVKRYVGRGLLIVIEVLLAVGICAVVTIVPLRVLGLLPIRDEYDSYLLGVASGGLLSSFLIKLLRQSRHTARYFS